MDSRTLILPSSEKKTEVIVFTTERVFALLPIQVSEVMVLSKPDMKYLRIMVDTRMSFFERIYNTISKAVAVGGPLSNRYRLLMSAVEFVVLYSSEVWAESLNKEMHCKRLAQI